MTQRVNVDNFKRAESDNYFAKFAREGGIGRFNHAREAVAIEKQDVIRMNRDTLYSSAVVDLDASAATVILPEAGKRYMAMQVINEDQYTRPVYYGAGSYTLTHQMIGTRYAGVAVRVLVDPRDKNELQQIHSLQDAIKVI